MKNQPIVRSTRWWGPRTLIFIVVVGLGVAVALAFMLPVRAPGPKNAALMARQQAMEVLGTHIAKLRPSCRVLVLSNPFTKEAGYLNEKSQFERAGIRGLKKGLAGRVGVDVVFPTLLPEYATQPELVPIPPDCRTPLSFLVQASSIEALAEAHPDCRVIVSLIGLPVGVDHLKLWQQKDPRCFALLLPDLRLLGPPEEAAKAFHRGKLLAAVVEDATSGDPLVVTGNNVIEVLERQPRALGY